MTTGALFDPALHHAYYQHQWASDSAHAVIVCVRDVHRLSPAFPALFKQVRLYRHKAWPCVYATLVATVVAGRETGTSMEYTGRLRCLPVDDGSGVLDIQCPATLRVVDTAPKGVYDCYIRTQQVYRTPQLEVGQILQCTGRVFERRDRPRSMEVVAMEVAGDPNREPLHILQALDWAAHVYTNPPDWPSVCQGAEAPAWTAALPADTRAPADHGEATLDDADRMPAPVPPLEPAPTTRAMTVFLASYLHQKTTAALGPRAPLVRSAVPRFRLDELVASASVRRQACRLVAYKLGLSSNQTPPRDKVHRLVAHCLAVLVRTGHVLRHGGDPPAFQVIGAPLLAAYIAPLLLHTPRHRQKEIEAFSSRGMHRRLRHADPRLRHVPLHQIDAALTLLADRGLLTAHDGVWGVTRVQ